MKKLTIEDVRNYLLTNDINNDCTLLSSVYINSHEPLKFRCNQCGKEFERSFTNVKRNQKYSCARCSQNRFLTIEEIKKQLEKLDAKKECTLLSDKYENYKSPLLFRCNNCGKEFTRAFYEVKSVKCHKCYECAKKEQGGYNKHTIQDVKNFIKEYDINQDCELISTEYVNQYTPLLFKCRCCGKEFERTFATMKAKKAFKCFRCAHNFPDEFQVKNYPVMKNYFRSKLYLWKKDILSKCHKCDITGVSYDLDVHHLVSFSTILQQASANTNIPLDILPKELEQNGYSLQLLEEEFMKLHNEIGKAVVLNKEVHSLFHKLYGYKNNTPEQYIEFKERYKKGELKINL